jgi:hypothetical protein
MRVKHLIASIALLLLFAPWGIAQEEKPVNSITERAVSLEIYAQLQSYYKFQNNYRTPLDGNDRFIADAKANSDNATTYDAETSAGGKNRHGANNRADQNTRTIGDLSLVGRAGAMQTDGIDWYQMIAVLQIQIDANDPDHPDYEDGDRNARVRHRDIWVRYAPALPIGIKIGSQTIASTATAAAIGHRFVGDQDDDFIFYTAAALVETPGITIDVHLSKDIELGLGTLEGMGDASRIATGGSSSEARNNVVWFKGNFGMVDITAGYQSITVGETEDNSDNGIQDEYQHEYKHTLLNLVTKFNFGDFSPYFAYQVLEGDKVVNKLTSGTVNDSVSAFGESLEVQTNESRSMKGNFYSLGLIANVGPGKLAVDYTKSTVPAYGETDSVSALVELDYATQLNYTIPITEDAEITLFYNQMQAKKDGNLRDDIQHMKNNVAIAKTGIVSADSIRTLEQYTTLLETYRWTSTTSYGVNFQVKFGN